jgi:hypothetical protein
MARTTDHRTFGEFLIPHPSLVRPATSLAPIAMSFSPWTGGLACFFPCRLRVSIV